MTAIEMIQAGIQFSCEDDSDTQAARSLDAGFEGMQQHRNRKAPIDILCPHDSDPRPNFLLRLFGP